MRRLKHPEMLGPHLLTLVLGLEDPLEFLSHPL